MSSTTATSSPLGGDGQVRPLTEGLGVPQQSRAEHDPGAWVPEPLAPGALGADAPPRGADGVDHDDDDADDADGGLFAELPPLPLTGPLAEALATARAGLDDAVAAAHHLADTTAAQRLEVLTALAEARHVAEAAMVRVTASFTSEEVRELGSTDVVDLLVRHTGASPARAKTEKALAAALTAPVRPLPAGYDPDGPADPDGPGDGSGEESDHDVPFDLDASDAPDGAGSPSSGAGPVPGSVTSAVALGRLGAVHAAGRLSTDVAALATRTVASLPAGLRRSHGGAADDLLARLLPDLTHEQARTVCATLALTLDPDRADRGHDPDELERRHLDLSVHEDGWGGIRGLLDPETTAELKAFLDARSKPSTTVAAPLAPDQLDDPEGPGGRAQQPARDGAGGGADGGADGGAGGVSVRDVRSPGQRRHDALAEGIRAALGEAGTRGGEPVRVIVTTTAEQLADLPGAGRATNETTGRGLTRAQLARVACCGSLQAVRLSCAGAQARVLSLGRSVRLFTASQRRAMLARDGGCVIPGCTAPPAMLEAHHAVDWQHGGPTDVDSGVLLCTRHHVLVTVGVWEVAVVAGVPQVRPPRTVDPLRRWVRNPRRSLVDAVHSAAERVVEQLLLDPPEGWADDAPPRGGPGEPGPPDPAPDIPSPRGTCTC